MPKNPEQEIFQDSKVLIVDDEEILAWSIETELKAHGADVHAANSLRTAIEAFNRVNPDVAICDLRLPDGNGMELLKKWRHEKPDMPVILITAHGAVESAIDALRLGAFDYLQKPFDMKSLIASVKRASELSMLRQKVNRLTGFERPRDPFKIIGKSPAMMKVKEQLRRIANSKANTVLITGESGSGKELAARAVHDWSDRAAAPFVEINCASIPENLLESELFGYEKGAFTDARDRKLGLFEMAQNGTIFLDEIGEMPMKLQTKLLRALEYRRFKRLGGTKDIVFNARIVCATNRDLLDEIHEKQFRADLYYRLSALPVEIPPLRDRLEDVDDLVDFFVDKISKDLEIKSPEVGHAVKSMLKNHSWPGNIRELKNVLERALVFHSPDHLEVDHITLDTPRSQKPKPEPQVSQVPPTSHNGHGLHSTHSNGGSYYGDSNQSVAMSLSDETFHLPESGLNLEGLEKSLLIQALDKARNNQTKAAALLGISRHTFRYRLEKYGILNH
ncbi:sigma-54-dependent transcriptional regulator [Pseudobacteriovorax antillogorgiicola]|uniref:Two component, sigma54 specific, transcriptional regulator, Fis family n=1 Tax=Pseudobacteriovorax antillogorgiicola TaxID=1513793 RepID=A0A1Y6BDP9_9BACT|nr:sigma-54 dependent transcriptional regulator [Pseudobacteriovorax antillogorgiicola]TCS56401.1 two component Fis family sigma54 specific transcriptional regulator [Pseudobacteriovorax antillogorgiicola]SMF06065.1 two component, sigma54 specific, transcriptional regulator, Fis family [Pseudobacteriovorax antillogorgiicola]